MNGYLILDKPAGRTSFDVVRSLRKLLRTKKIGHGGTLDPMVTGVLPVFVGNATRAEALLPDTDKEYECVMKLGVKTDTEDITGTVLAESEVKATEEEVREVLASFVGEYLQTPPMYSAKKVDGKKLYDLARAGWTVERKAELRTIRELEVLSVDLPEVRFRVTCSKGTYVRTLCADIGERLGTYGAMAYLRRLRHGRFKIDGAVTLSDVEKASSEGRAKTLLFPTEDLFSDLPKLILLPEADRFLKNGNVLYPENVQKTEPKENSPETILSDGQRFRVAFSTGEFGGIYAFSADERAFSPVRIFPA